jgi:prevent-host-death family protein
MMAALLYVSEIEAVDRFDELLARVEAGETVVITRGGKPVVNFVPYRREGTDNLK